MKTEKFSRTSSLLLIATLTLAFAGTVSAAAGEMNESTGLPAHLYDAEGVVDKLALLTYFLFFVGYIAMGLPSSSL